VPQFTDTPVLISLMAAVLICHYAMQASECLPLMQHAAAVLRGVPSYAACTAKAAEYQERFDKRALSKLREAVEVGNTGRDNGESCVAVTYGTVKGLPGIGRRPLPGGGFVNVCIFATRALLASNPWIFALALRALRRGARQPVFALRGSQPTRALSCSLRRLPRPEGGRVVATTLPTLGSTPAAAANAAAAANRYDAPASGVAISTGHCFMGAALP